MDFSQFQGLGWGTAVAVLMIGGIAVLWRAWEHEDRRRRAIGELRQKYADAIKAGDLELAGTIGRRLRELEAEKCID